MTVCVEGNQSLVKTSTKDSCVMLDSNCFCELGRADIL